MKEIIIVGKTSMTSPVLEILLKESQKIGGISLGNLKESEKSHSWKKVVTSWNHVELEETNTC